MEADPHPKQKLSKTSSESTVTLHKAPTSNQQGWESTAGTRQLWESKGLNAPITT